MTHQTSGIERAIEVFVRAFSFGRSFTHPYQADRQGPLWVLRDAPRSNGAYRNEEWVGCGVAPAYVDRFARRDARGRFAVSMINGVGQSDQPMREGFKALGYRLKATEPFMVHPLRRIPRCSSPAAIQRVTTADLAAQLGKATRSRPLRPQYLQADSPLRQYVALSDGQLVGRVRSVTVGDATWCADMYVSPEFRRRGIARAMLCRMLRDDRAAGAKMAVLLASHVGARLYPVVGYEQIGTLLLWSPPKR